MSEQNKYHQFTLNAQAPDEYGNTYNGTFETKDGRRFWMNAKDVNGSNGPFISGYVGKPKQPKQAPQTPPAAPKPSPEAAAEADPFDDDIPF